MNLFDDIDRNDAGPGLYAEPEFAYLNRSARPEAIRVRSVLEDWFCRYPDADKQELCQRFRSNDWQHHSAFFELFLHELLIRLGLHVEIHPSLTHTTLCPDFLVESPKGDSFYMEAVLATNASSEDGAARARMNVVYDALDRLESPNSFIGMNIQGAPATPPPARQMRSFLAQQLKSLDPDQVAQTQDRSAIPMWDYEHAGWRVQFFPIPKSVEARGKPGIRPLGYWQDGPYSLTSREAIREAVVLKGGRYGTLDRPYVIAVDALGGGVDRSDEFYALFGDEQWILHETATGEPKVELARNGVWTSKSGPRYTRVSAVLLVRGAICWRVPDAPVCLYHNPWAAQPYTAELNRLPRAVFKSDTMEWLDGETLSDIFGLPLGWPEVE